MVPDQPRHWCDFGKARRRHPTGGLEAICLGIHLSQIFLHGTKMAKQDETKTLQDKNWCLGVKWEFTFCRVESLFLQQEIYSSPCCSPSAPPLFRRPVGFWHGEAGGGQRVKEGALSLRFCCTLGARESKIKEWACHDSKPPARCTACSSFPVLYWSSFIAHRVWQCWAWLWASQQIPCCNPLDYRRKPSLHLRTIRLAQHGKEQEPGWPGKIPPGHLLPWWEEPWGNWGIPPVVLGKDAAGSGNLMKLGVNVQGNLNLLSWVLETTVLEESYVTSTWE